MSNIQEREVNVETTEDSSRFAPCWSGCTGVFNDFEGVSSRENEELHYRKHARIGHEWETDISLGEYRSLATQHLNCVDADHVIELCQTADLAVVKYNLESGELGIARSDDGAIKTFFRPRDVAYVLRKVDAGMWGEPALADGFDTLEPSLAVADDRHIGYLFARLDNLAMELPSQAHLVVVGLAEGSSVSNEVLSMLARLGEYRFCVFELQRRVLTEAQTEILFARRKKIVGAAASFEALERYRAQALTNAIAVDFETSITAQELFWREAADLIGNSDEFEDALDRRQILGYAILELKVLQLHRRLLELDVQAYEHRVRKSDIYLRSVFYQLAVRFGYRETHHVSPEAFFWRRMGKNINYTCREPERAVRDALVHADGDPHHGVLKGQIADDRPGAGEINLPVENAPAEPSRDLPKATNPVGATQQGSNIPACSDATVDCGDNDRSSVKSEREKTLTSKHEEVAEAGKHPPTGIGTPAIESSDIMLEAATSMASVTENPDGTDDVAEELYTVRCPNCGFGGERGGFCIACRWPL